MKLWAMLCRATQDGRVMVESFHKTWSTGEGNGKPVQYSCLGNPMNSMNSSCSTTNSSPHTTTTRENPGSNKDLEQQQQKWYWKLWTMTKMGEDLKKAGCWECTDEGKNVVRYSGKKAIRLCWPFPFLHFSFMAKCVVYHLSTQNQPAVYWHVILTYLYCTDS